MPRLSDPQAADAPPAGGGRRHALHARSKPALKVSAWLSGNRYYKASVEKLQQQADELRGHAATLSASNDLLRGEEQVLRDLCLQQTLLLYLLQRIIPGDACELPDELLAAAGHGEGSGIDGAELLRRVSGCFIFRLLSNVTEEQLQRARSLSAQGWCRTYSELVSELCLLRSLAARGEPQQPGVDALRARMCRMADDFYALHSLTILYNAEVEVRKACHINLATGRPAHNMPRSHWRSLVKALDLAPQQVSRLLLAFRHYKRLKRLLSAVQVSAANDMAAATSELGHTLRKAEGQLAPVPGGGAGAGSSGSGSAGGVPPAAAAGPPSADEAAAIHKVERVLAGTTLASGQLSFFVLDVLTDEQRVTVIVKSFPFIPRPAAFLEAVEELHAQQLAEPLQQLAPPGALPPAQE